MLSHHVEITNVCGALACMQRVHRPVLQEEARSSSRTKIQACPCVFLFLSRERAQRSVSSRVSALSRRELTREAYGEVVFADDADFTEKAAIKPKTLRSSSAAGLGQQAHALRKRTWYPTQMQGFQVGV